MTRTRGFTLLEMLLATALLAILMTGILSLVADFGASKAAFQAMHHDHSTPLAPANALDTSAVDAWVRVLQDDLQRAQTIDTKHENQIVLVGYRSLNAADRQPVHRPAQITYQIEEVAGIRCLIRRQALLDLPTNQNIQRDLVCTGIQQFTLTPQTPSTTTKPDQLNKSSAWILFVRSQSDTPRTFEQILYRSTGGGT